MHPMRRQDRAMCPEKAQELLQKGEYGILATVSSEGQPYSTPLSYYFEGKHIYFHSALTGHKIENICCNPRVSFTVVGNTQPVYDTGFSTYYESVIVFGQAMEVHDQKEKDRILTLLCDKYLPEHRDKVQHSIQEEQKRTAVYQIKIAQITGKQKQPK